MARYDKLVDRFKRRPPEADFEDVRRLLEAHGWRMRRGGKHTAVFTKGGRLPLTVPNRKQEDRQALHSRPGVRGP